MSVATSARDARLTVGAGRALVAAVVVAALGVIAGPVMLGLMLPYIDVVLVVVARSFQVLSVGLVREGADSMLEARAVLREAVLLGPQWVRPDGRTGFAVTTAAGTVLQPLLLAAWLALAWPGGLLLTLWRLAALALLGPLVLALDAPLYLHGSLWDMLVARHRPGQVSLPVAWMHFLTGGGRLGLGLVAGALAIGLGQRLARRRARGDMPR